MFYERDIWAIRGSSLRPGEKAAAVLHVRVVCCCKRDKIRITSGSWSDHAEENEAVGINLRSKRTFSLKKKKELDLGLVITIV